MAPILRRLGQVSDEVQRAVLVAVADEKKVPALELKVAHLIAAMRRAANVAVATTPGLTRPNISAALAWRTEKTRALAKVIKLGDKPSLAMSMAMVDQARFFGSDLTGTVSDTLVTTHTAELDDECGPDEVLIVEPERDACVICLRYAGLYRAASETFPAGLSFDAKTPGPEDRPAGPPFHNRCRCGLAIIPKAAARDNSAALHREAQRSILKGWALPSEGNAARVRAAEELLKRNVVAPKSVIAETRKRLKAGGSFTRDVP